MGLVVQNSIDTIDIISIPFGIVEYRIPYLGIDTWYCHWNSDQKCQKKKKNNNNNRNLK